MRLEEIHTELTECLGPLGIGCDAGVLDTWIRRRQAGREPLPLDAVRRLHKLTGSLLDDMDRGAV